MKNDILKLIRTLTKWQNKLKTEKNFRSIVPHMNEWCWRSFWMMKDGEDLFLGSYAMKYYQYKTASHWLQWSETLQLIQKHCSSYNLHFIGTNVTYINSRQYSKLVTQNTYLEYKPNIRNCLTVSTLFFNRTDNQHEWWLYYTP